LQRVDRTTTCPRDLAIMSIEEDVPHPPGTNNYRFHWKQFFAEQVGWAAMALSLGWAIIGGFGDGWISRRDVSSETDDAAIEFQKFIRRDSPADVRLSLPLDASSDSIQVHISEEFLDAVRLERIVPLPEGMELDSDGATARFHLASGQGRASIAIEYKAKHPGRLHGRLRIAGGSELAFDQFVYP